MKKIKELKKLFEDLYGYRYAITLLNSDAKNDTISNNDSVNSLIDYLSETNMTDKRVKRKLAKLCLKTIVNYSITEEKKTRKLYENLKSKI